MKDTVRNTVITAIEKYFYFFLRSFATYSNEVRSTALNESFNGLALAMELALAANPDWVDLLRCDRMSVRLDRKFEFS